ncbi:DUF4058 family protein [Scytonema sp. UIC 10036]|nr:DUF4058 family protein [Scytonema sp. UIC 10036]MUG92961.1 DUF4058 family protein [Scytonema sp. UIC 10036]
MPSPFPGMDPYLEHPSSWPNVHHRLITAIADSISPQLLPKYQVLIEERIYQTIGEDSLLVGIPDAVVKPTQATPIGVKTNVAVSLPTQPLTVILPLSEKVRQGHLEIRDIATSEVVTAVEVLSPANKRSGEGRRQYETKRQTILESTTHLVEIDLLRHWEPMLALGNNIQTHYRILVSQSSRRPIADLYAFNLPNPIPSFKLPLRSEDTEPLINLQDLLNGVYDRSGYGFVIDYSREPVPPLAEVDEAWIDTWLREKKLR